MAIQKRNNKKQGKSPSKYIRFTSVAFQMGATIWLGNLLGKWLDSKYNQDFWESTVTLLSVFIAMYMVIIQVIKVSKEDD
ncbi:AtpZ/AtpI family protein [Psychroserpens luteus]|uniref:AtpZ/AtpI family protein n=1 Tax=Psychroserpens luteus TaxID=1434066 RepID=A0ABW5ZVD2_9FLAO|nr:AtpZ/AtpI family protein [Psychroserpens luteus]